MFVEICNNGCQQGLVILYKRATWALYGDFTKSSSIPGGRESPLIPVDPTACAKGEGT